MHYLHWKRFATALALVGLAQCEVTACDTPVYRYAMYRWEPAAYELYHVFNEELSTAEQAIHTEMEIVASRLAPNTNLRLVPIDLRSDDPWQAVPADVKRHWEQTAEGATPAYLIVSPHGALVNWREEFSPDDLASLMDSPARQRIAKGLSEAHAAVFVLLAGNDPLANKLAEQELNELQRQVEAGEVELYQPPAAGGVALAARAKPTEENPPVSMIRIERNDPQEQWLVQTLVATESGLDDPAKPLVFPVYGRGRALPPFVGAGISVANLLQSVLFVTGACSCTVKDENPGVDLLTTYNWQQAADGLMERFGAEEGNERFTQDDLFPQLIIPGETGLAPASQPQPSVTDGESGEENLEALTNATAADSRENESSGKPQPALPDHEEAHAKESAPTAHTSENSRGEATPVDVTAETPASEAQFADDGGMMFNITLGAILGIVLLAVGTLLLMRRG